MIRRNKQPMLHEEEQQPPQNSIRTSASLASKTNDGDDGNVARRKINQSKKSSLSRMFFLVAMWVLIIVFTMIIPKYTIVTINNNSINDNSNNQASISSQSTHKTQPSSSILPPQQQQRTDKSTSQSQYNSAFSNNPDPHKVIQQKDQPVTDILSTSIIKPDFHLVFSTGCSLFQDWQSYVFFYHVYKVGQSGNVTRIVSGCNKEKEQMLTKTHQEQIKSTMSNNFLLHFTPDYSHMKGPQQVEEYKYFNKPLGMKHWMEYALGYNDNTTTTTAATANPYDDVIVVLLDPDQLLLRPFTHDYTNIRMDWTRKGFNNNPNISKVVRQGKSITQTYAFQDAFATLNLTHVLLNEGNDGGKDSPLWTMSKKRKLGYAAGPPYLATAKDFYTIANKWSELVPRVHDVYPYLLAEMYAYCIASIQVGLRPMTASGFMVSNVDVQKGEGWYWIDRKEEEEQRSTSGSTKLIDKINNPDYGDFCPSSGQQQQLQQRQDTLPFVLHYCQRYGTELKGRYYFSKYEMRPKFLSCGVELLQEPTLEDIAIGSKGVEESINDNDFKDNKDGRFDLKRLMFRPRNRHRDAWVLCTLIPAINEAAIFFKRHHCPADSFTNYNKTRIFSRKGVIRFNWA